MSQDIPFHVRTFKIVLLGDGGVGKTALSSVYRGEGFKASYMMTIGMDPASKYEIYKFESDERFIDGRVTLQIWDLAGQDRFKDYRGMYTRGSSGALMVFDVSRRLSFESIETWMDHLPPNTPTILVGNKIDLSGLRDISYEEGVKTAKEFGFLGYMETSAMLEINVAEVFRQLGFIILEKTAAKTKGKLKPLKHKYDLEEQNIINISQKYINKIKNQNYEDYKPFFDLIDNIEDVVILRIVKTLEQSTDTKALNLLAKFYNTLSGRYQKKGDFTLQFSYKLKSINCYLSLFNLTSRYEWKKTAIKEVIISFWNNLKSLVAVESWIEKLKSQREIFELCYREGGQLFHIALRLYNALVTKNPDELTASKTSLEQIKIRADPEWETTVIQNAEEAFEKISKTMPKCRILSYEFQPEHLVLGYPVSLNIVLRNNTPDERTFTTDLDYSGFEFKNDNQKYKFKSREQFELSFPLGKIQETSNDKMSINIRLLDEKKNTISTDIIPIPKIWSKVKPLKILSVETKNESNIVVMDKETSIILDVKIHNPSLVSQKVKLDLDAPKFILSQNKDFYLRKINPEKTEIEKFILGTPEKSGNYKILIKLLNVKDEIIEDSDTEISFKFKKSKKKIILEFIKGVIAVGAKSASMLQGSI